MHGPAPLPPSLAETRAGWITKINVFYDGKCIVGIKPTYGYSSLGAQLLGRQEGRSTDMALVPHRGNFITRAEARVGDRWGCGGGHANRARQPATSQLARTRITGMRAAGCSWANAAGS